MLVDQPEKCYFQEKQVQIHPTISLNNIERASYQKHVGVIRDRKLNFKKDIDCAISKVNKGISLITNIKHYVVIIYDQPQNEFFCVKS